MGIRPWKHDDGPNVGMSASTLSTGIRAWFAEMIDATGLLCERHLKNNITSCIRIRFSAVMVGEGRAWAWDVIVGNPGKIFDPVDAITKLSNPRVCHARNKRVAVRASDD